jgi:hypothetical protein
VAAIAKRGEVLTVAAVITAFEPRAGAIEQFAV